MSNIQASLNSLIKYNNGYFKSEKQAKFLLSMLEDNNTFLSGFNGYTMLIQYAFDDKGITLKTKTSQTTGKTEEVWGRKVDGVLSVAELQIVKNLTKQLKKVKTSYDKAVKSFNDGSYFGDKQPKGYELEVYNNCRKQELELIAKIQKAIADYK